MKTFIIEFEVKLLYGRLYGDFVDTKPEDMNQIIEWHKTLFFDYIDNHIFEITKEERQELQFAYRVHPNYPTRIQVKWSIPETIDQETLNLLYTLFCDPDEEDEYPIALGNKAYFIRMRIIPCQITNNS